jgi:hypothetical protein
MSSRPPGDLPEVIIIFRGFIKILKTIKEDMARRRFN